MTGSEQAWKELVDALHIEIVRERLRDSEFIHWLLAVVPVHVETANGAKILNNGRGMP